MKHDTIKYAIRRVFRTVLLLTLYANTSRQGLHAADEQPFGIDHRIPLTTSRVIGSPEPPLPYTVEKTFTKIKWQSPIYVASEPGSDSLLIVQLLERRVRTVRAIEMAIIVHSTDDRVTGRKRRYDPNRT